MAFSDDELDRYIDAASALNALPIEATCRPGVRQFLRVAAEMAATLDDAELDPDELAPASIYTPPERDDKERS